MDYVPVYRATTGPEVSDFLRAKACGYSNPFPTRADILAFLATKGG